MPTAMARTYRNYTKSNHSVTVEIRGLVAKRCPLHCNRNWQKPRFPIKCTYGTTRSQFPTRPTSAFAHSRNEEQFLASASVNVTIQMILLHHNMSERRATGARTQNTTLCRRRRRKQPRSVRNRVALTRSITHLDNSKLQ